MILAVIESDYGTLHLVDKLTLEGKEYGEARSPIVFSGWVVHRILLY